MEKRINDILSAIEVAISDFQGAIPAAQKKIFNALQPLIKKFEIKDGNLINNVKNLKLLGELRNTLQRFVVSPEYKNAVEKFIGSFNDVSELNNQYFRNYYTAFTPKQAMKTIKKLAVESTINGLLGQGMNNTIVDPIQKILNQNITSGGNYASFTEQLREHILTTETDGSLERYTRQITTDAINQFSAQYHETIAQDLNFEWGRYVGSNITTSRQFCVLLTAKQWIHKSELPSILQGHIDGEECKLSKTTGLPLGMIPGTNPQNFNIVRGGYTCGHQYFRVPNSAVPPDVLSKMGKKVEPAAKQDPPVSVKKEVNKTIDLSKAEIHNIKSLETIFSENESVISPLFNNTKFKTLNTTRREGVNGSTDMNGNISLSEQKTAHTLAGFNNLKNGVDLTHDQEKAFATLWHEIWHNTNKATTTYITKTERRYMELGNEFVSRKTLDDFFEMFNSKLKDVSLKANRNDTGYNTWVRNYDRLIKHLGADESQVLSYMKDKMKNGDYDNVKKYLGDALQNAMGNNKTQASFIKSALSDAINYRENEFAEKYKIE